MRRQQRPSPIRDTLVVDEFTDDVALEAGEWDQRSRVLAKAVVGPVAVAVIDANGADGGVTYENTETFSWDEHEGWTWQISSGGYGSGWNNGIAYACGPARADELVVVEFRHERHSVDVQPSGYWLFAAASKTTKAFRGAGHLRPCPPCRRVAMRRSVAGRSQFDVDLVSSPFGAVLARPRVGSMWTPSSHRQSARRRSSLEHVRFEAHRHRLGEVLRAPTREHPSVSGFRRSRRGRTPAYGSSSAEWSSVRGH